jgi:hypothetical protein
MVKCCVFFAVRTELLNNSSARSATAGRHVATWVTLATWRPWRSDDYGARGDRCDRGVRATVLSWRRGRLLRLRGHGLDRRVCPFFKY